MFVNRRICPIIFWILIIENGANRKWNAPNSSAIRFYERQYHKGIYRTLNPQGIWSNSQRSQINIPYSHFHTKSVRPFCPTTCRWQICHMQRRLESNLKKRKGCGIMSNGDSPQPPKRLVSSYNVLGHARRLPHKRRFRNNSRQKKKKKYVPHNLTALATTKKVTKNDNTNKSSEKTGVNNPLFSKEIVSYQDKPNPVSGISIFASINRIFKNKLLIFRHFLQLLKTFYYFLR